ncbi:hypothetical protein ABZS83_05210 [Streptomyces sp. NPDC005426]|uniref:hypothetical protein n=1 Tax=Streptomyces sp. NPDC005426 TaxID=3155344 RepID=UPI0033AB773E
MGGMTDISNHINYLEIAGQDVTACIQTRPWVAEHQLTIRTQIESRPGPADPATGERWAEHRKTGLVLVACNCGYTTGWTPAAELPTLAELTQGHEKT